MRPVRLEFAGLRSYRAAAVIDFADLDLFAIVGDTGAGKSTIIEALSLALYGKKTWTRGGSAKSDLIADGETVMRIELTFDADGQRWTVTRSWRRSGPGINKLERVDKTDKVDGSVEVTKRITELLGLDHAQFTQAVVMPQGRFDELLQASASDRSRLLASILGLDAVRRTGAEAGALRARWLEPLALATDRRAHLPLDPVAATTDAERAETVARERFELLTAAVTVIGTHQARADAVGRAADRLGTVLDALPDPALAVAASAELSAARALGEELAERHRALRAESRVLDEQLGRLDDDAVKLLGGFADRDAAVAARSQVEAAVQGLRRDAVEVDAARAELAALVAAAPPDHPDAALADAAAVAGAAVIEARAAADAGDADHERARRSWEIFDAARTYSMEADAAVEATHAALSTALAEVKQATHRRDAAARAAADARRALDRARVADAAALAAASCQPGDDCPVCRQVLPDDFEAPAAGELAAALDAVEVATGVLDAARDHAVGAERDATHAAAAYERAAAAAAHATADRADASATAVAAGCDVQASTPTDALVAVDGARTVARQALADAVETARVADAALAEAVAQVRTAGAAHRASVESAQAALTASERRVEAHASVARALPDGWRPAGAATIDLLEGVVADVTAMLGALDANATERAEVDATRAAAARELDQVAGRAEHEVTRVAERALAVLNGRLERIRDVATARAAATEVSTATDADLAPDPAAVLAAPEPLPATAKASELGELVDVSVAGIEAADAIEADARQVLGRLRAEQLEVSGALASAVLATGCATADEVRREHGVADAEVTQAAATVARARADRDAAAALDRFLAVAGPFVANLTVLAEALRDRQFVDHLVTAREAELIAEADRRLRAISGARFGFVRDFGIVSVASGEVRTPDALSGGERFQAALALALSLVEIASRGRGKLEAVFVDEGFGSLDSRSLDAALATLGDVAGGGKMVGLISHLKPVAEAVETVLLVTKDDVRGSTIRRLDGEAREQMLDDDIRSGLTA